MQANGQVNIFLNEAMSQEVTYETGGNAENPSAGLRINVIPRDGGNAFGGLDVCGAVGAVNGEIDAAIKGMDAGDQRAIAILGAAMLA